MRIIRIVVVLLITFGAMFPKLSLASDSANTETDINIFETQFNNIENSMIPDLVLDKKPISEIFQYPQEPKVIVDERLNHVLTQWKEKQTQLWNALSSKPFVVNASAYTASADECGNSKGITSSGLKVEANRTIACPGQFPFGTKIEIEGMGTYVCEDRGGAIKGNHFDIYMQTKKEAFAFGRKSLNAHVVLE